MCVYFQNSDDGKYIFYYFKKNILGQLDSRVFPRNITGTLSLGM
jgi:hypothetical protein